MGRYNYAYLEDYPTIVNDLMDEQYYNEEEDVLDEIEVELLAEAVQYELDKLNDTYSCYELTLIGGNGYGLQIVPQVTDYAEWHRYPEEYNGIEEYDPARDKVWNFTEPYDIHSYIDMYWDTFAHNIENDIKDKEEAITDEYGYWDIDQDMDAALAIVKALQEQAKAEQACVIQDMIQIAEDYGFADAYDWEGQKEYYQKAA